MTGTSRLYGLYIHNLSKIDDAGIALEAMTKFLDEKPPLAYEYGDVIVLKPDNDIAKLIHDVMVKGGFIVDYIEPNQLYRLIDAMVLHYVFVDNFMEQSEVEQYVYDWEISNRLTLADLRYTRYIKTFFMQGT